MSRVYATSYEATPLEVRELALRWAARVPEGESAELLKLAALEWAIEFLKGNDK